MESTASGALLCLQPSLQQLAMTLPRPHGPARSGNRRLRWLVALALWLAAAVPGYAHDPGLSSLRVTFTPAGVETKLTVHFFDLEALAPDLDANHDGRLDAAEFARARARLLEIARHPVDLALGEDGSGSFTPAADPKVELLGDNNLQFTTRFLAPGPASGATRLTVTSRLIGTLPRGHRHFLEVLGPDGRNVGEGFLAAAADHLSFALPTAGAAVAAVEPPRPVRFGEFFFLGVNHLLTGYDHLLFLAGLLLVCRSLLKAFQMLTLFTVAHSVTLTLVTLDWLKPSSAIVEPMIAASIAYIGIENIFRPRADLSWRGVLTFVFGLVHGMGFAGALKELGVGSGGTSGVFRPLLFFSLGLEATQLGLAALVFPLLLWLRTKPAFPRLWVPACSGLIALAGLYWLVERTLLGG